MSQVSIPPNEALKGMAEEQSPVLEMVLQMNLESIEACGLDPKTFHLVRLATLVAINAPPVSYLVHLAAAMDAGVTVEDAQGVLIAIAPLTGTARLTAAAGNVLRGFGLAEMIEDN